MTLTADQARAVQAGGSVAVTAGAGTGKTHMLTERYLHHLLEDGLRPLHIVAATFTERAAAELRGRIRARLAGLEDGEALAAQLEAAQIGTLHSLAGRICREHPEAAGVPYDFSVQDELEQRLWFERHYRQALPALPERISRALPFPVLDAALRTLLADPLTAREALDADPASWPAFIETERRRVFGRLASGDDWRQAVATLEALAGPAEDRMEQQRKAALGAIKSLAAGDFTPEAMLTLDRLSRAFGSRKYWGSALEELKQACGTLRDAYRQVKPVLELEMGAPDERLRLTLPLVAEGFELIREELALAKRAQRLLDFNDLELHALQALEQDQVREFYRQRWKAFLIDEFQDTNQVQARLLERLCGEASEALSRLTVVGDEKQSIYGFRRADIEVFRRVGAALAQAGGTVASLGTSFRTHAPLMEQLNEVVAPTLGELHQPLHGARGQAPGEGPFLSVHLIAGGPGLKQYRQRAEADMLGALVTSLLEEAVLVHDRDTGRPRSVRPGDIAILARKWDSLGPYGDELAARGIPTIHAGGGNLLDQREAKDAVSLLRFLADPLDDLALASLLRSPYFAVDDRSLTVLAAVARGRGWWSALRDGAAVTLPGAAATLGRLLAVRQEEPPSRLLVLADELTGYSAVIASLPGGPRRLADWRGFIEFVRLLERGHGDAFSVVRELRALQSLEGAKAPRPAMEAGDAVSLMTVHNAKGLEWPIVILPDITGRPAGGKQKVLFEAQHGVAFEVEDEDGELLTPALFTLLDERRREREAQEEFRVLYVALTRARDRVIISGNEEDGGRLRSLAAGLTAAAVEPNLHEYDPQAALPKTPRAKAATSLEGALLGHSGAGLFELPVSSLASYAACPKRFHFEQVLRHPGAGEGRRLASRVGSLTHLALEREIRDAAELGRFDRPLEREHVERALELADTFRTKQLFRQLRQGIRERERPVRVEIEGLVLHGVVDAVGDGFILDYKTGRRTSGEGHLLQVAVYAMALERPVAHLAYLATNELVSYQEQQLASARKPISLALHGIASGDFTATPSSEQCGNCNFSVICSDSAS